MITIDVPAILASLQWWHLLWVVCAGMCWAVGRAVVDVIVRRMTSTPPAPWCSPTIN